MKDTFPRLIQAQWTVEVLRASVFGSKLAEQVLNDDMPSTAALRAIDAYAYAHCEARDSEIAQVAREGFASALRRSLNMQPRCNELCGSWGHDALCPNYDGPSDDQIHGGEPPIGINERCELIRREHG